MVKNFRKIQIFQIVVRFSLTDFSVQSVGTMLFQYVRKVLLSASRGNYFPRGEELNNGVNRVEG